MKRALILFIITLLLMLPLAAQDIPPTGGNRLDSPYAGDPDIPAPEFVTGLDWINVESPVTLASLRGKIVILDFWTYGCINCIHMIPTLARLEAQYGDALVVIGVHSAKFANEGITDNLRQIVQRYNIHHPVVNDRDFTLWRQYAVNAWPTFYVIDPRGNVIARQAGEIPFDVFDRLLGGMIEFWDSIGEIDRTPLALALEGADQPQALLHFPGKVLADDDGGRLFISDSGNHRVIVADIETFAVLDVIGTGAVGMRDGGFDTAQLNQPQGLSLDAAGERLYIADLKNHAVRVADLRGRTLTTLAGTGVQSFTRLIPGDTQPLNAPLSSPWDVLVAPDGRIHVAIAGQHQLWVIDPAAATAGPLVGDGREAALNATLRLSQLAQPSGLFLRGDVLYFADSESSTIRAADLAADRVETVAGTQENNLFDFGDRDGAFGDNRLQHPLSVTGAAEGAIFIADTYNSRIKAYDTLTRGVQTIAGAGGGGGFRDGVGTTAEFNEPGGISYASGRLYIADTNNHAVRIIDLSTLNVTTVQFANPERLVTSGEIRVIGGNRMRDESLILPEQRVAPGAGEVVLRFVLPDGYKINDLAPSCAEWSSPHTAITLPEPPAGAITALETRVPVTFSEGSGTLYGGVSLFYCEAVNETLCFIDDLRVEVPIVVTADAEPGAILVERTIVVPAP